MFSAALVVEMALLIASHRITEKESTFNLKVLFVDPPTLLTITLKEWC